MELQQQITVVNCLFFCTIYYVNLSFAFNRQEFWWFSWTDFYAGFVHIVNCGSVRVFSPDFKNCYKITLPRAYWNLSFLPETLAPEIVVQFLDVDA